MARHAEPVLGRGTRATLGVALALAAHLSAACGGAHGTKADAGAPSDAGPPACGVGQWILHESAGPCGSCPAGFTDFVVLPIPPALADAGGTFADSEGNPWTFDPATCTATFAGGCDASDTIDLSASTASCVETCPTDCTVCPATCTIAPY